MDNQQMRQIGARERLYLGVGFIFGKFNAAEIYFYWNWDYVSCMGSWWLILS